MEGKSLWGDLEGLPEMKAPSLYLIEQGKILKKMTKDLLSFKVYNDTPYENTFVCTFYIVAELLNDYKYQLLSIYYGFEIYPLELHDAANNQKYKCYKESDYLDTLEKVFTSDQVRKIIASLISQSKAVKSL